MPESTGAYEWKSTEIQNYIKWISKSSGKQATFSPSTNIQVGDYGVIHEKSKEFKSHGNIFKDKEMLAMIPELVTDDVWKTVTSEEEDHLVITDSIMTDLGPNKDAKLRLQFKGDGVFLVMYRPRSVDIPQPIDLTKLGKIEKLNKMLLVTGVISCPSYALYNWHHYKETVNVTLNQSSSGISTNSGIKQGWTWDGEDQGWCKDGYNPEGDLEYTPLFSLTEVIDKSDDEKGNPDPPVPSVDPIKARLPIPPPSAGDGNELFTSGEPGVPPWLSKKSKRPEHWKNRPPAIVANNEVQGEPIPMGDLSVEPPSTTSIDRISRSNKASGAADQTLPYYSRKPVDDSKGCISSCCCCQ